MFKKDILNFIFLLQTFSIAGPVTNAGGIVGDTVSTVVGQSEPPSI